jgi:hypothetical protein
MSTEIVDQVELARRVAKTYADLVRETLSPAEWEIMRQRNMHRRDIGPCASGDFLNSVAFMDRPSPSTTSTSCRAPMPFSPDGSASRATALSDAAQGEAIRAEAEKLAPASP